MRSILIGGTAVLLAALSAGPLRGQGRGGAYIQAGPARSGLVDLNASTLRYSGWGFGGALGYRGFADGRRLEVAFGGSGSRLTSRITNGDANRESAYGVDTRLAMLWRAGAMPERRLTFFLGGEVGAEGLLRFHEYQWGATENFADIYGGARLAGMWELKRATGTVVSGTLSVPVLSVVARTPYYGLKAVPDFKLEGPLGLKGLSHRLRVEKPLSPRMSGLLDYRASLVDHGGERSMRVVEHRVGVGVEVRRRAP